MDRIKKLKVKKQDGTFSDYIPIGADAEYIDMADGDNLQEEINTINNKSNSYFSKLQVSENSNFLSVGKIGCTFTTINDAINYAKNYANINNRVGIVIFPGTYNEEITLLDSHGIDLFGIGNVIVSHSSTYPNAPIYITGDAKISNIHFLNSGEGAYAMHYEISQTGVTGKVEFFNCIFEVTNGVNTSSVGIGLGSNNTLRFNNCKFINNSNRAPFFLHTNAHENSHNVNVYVEYCEFIGQNQLNTAIIIDNGGFANGFTNSENLFHFIGNTSQNSKLVIYRRTQNEGFFGYIPYNDNGIKLRPDSALNDLQGINYESVNTDNVLLIGIKSNVASNNKYQYVLPFLNANLFNITINSATTLSNQTLSPSLYVKTTQSFVLEDSSEIGKGEPILVRANIKPSNSNYNG